MVIAVLLGCGWLVAGESVVASESGEALAVEAAGQIVESAAGALAEGQAAAEGAGEEIASPTGALPVEGDGPTAVPPAGAPPVGGAEPAELRQPAPLDLSAIEAEAERNPFIEPPVELAEILPQDYLKVSGQLRLHGIVAIAGERLALFNLAGEEEGRGKKSGITLHRYREGDQFSVEVEGREYRFTLRALENRAVLLTGDDQGDYRVWL
jgi:hypothetical protein